MRDQIASEFRKLTTTRSVYAMLGGLVAVVAIGVVAIVTGGGSTDLQAPLEQQAFLHVSLTIAPLFGLLLGLRSFTDEFRFGSIVPTLLASPVRRRVLGAKLVATAGGGVVLSLAAMAITIAVGVPLLVAKGVEVTWSTGALAVVVGRLVAATVLWTAIGVGLGWRFGTRWRRSPGRWSGSLLPRASCPVWCRTSRSISPALPASRSSASTRPTC